MYKKLILLFSASLIFACSSDDSKNNPETDETVLVSKITQTVYYSNTPEVDVINFNYNNDDKLLSVSNDNQTNRTEFIYNDNKITKANQFNGNILLRSTVLNYDGENLKSLITENMQKTEFNYINNVLSSETIFGINNDTWIQLQKNDYIFSNGNAIQKIQQNTNGQINSISKSTFTFDSKNNPMRDMPSIIKFAYYFEGFSGFNLNNTISQQSFSSPEATVASQTYSYETVYNSNNFPTQIIRKRDGENSPISKIVIEYR